MFSRTGRFRRADRLLRNREFTRVVKSGKRRSSTSFVVAIATRARARVPLSDGKTANLESANRRLGVTVSKRVGNSVVRNRVKRGIREWFRHSRSRLPAGTDTVVIARTPARDLSASELKAALDRMIGGVAAEVAE